MPLTGITVLEVGVFMAGPYATMQLADLGAQVLKVENPAGGDPVRQAGPFVGGASSPFARLNRNKKSVALDLKSPDGRAAFRRLADNADVLVENLRPGALRALRLDYDTLRTSNPGLVYASASGWGQDGPLATLPGLDIMAQARSGLMSITGPPGGPPAKIGIPVCDLVCGMYVAMAVLAALRERDHSGEGQHIDVSLLESGVSLAVWEAGKYFATGEVGGPLGTAHQGQAPYQAVRCADGWLTVGAITPKAWRGLCEVLGLQALADQDRFSDAYRRKANVDELIRRVEEATQHRTVAELVTALDAAQVPCAPISDYGEVFTADALTERDFLWDAPGGVRQLGSPMRLSRTPTRRDTAGPALGADTRAVLLAVGYTNDEVDALVGGQS
ncbi:CaiB/BaiF CoA transferase family protein [Kibdelosporangium phytohabitans]|uniref:CoA-transferase n=1 Tax=Kibdelosporangium phytohabitans TaxID=860235 RepID=A0A0N7F4Y0_9PSEU|nr:CoA transferase [Kibdelosporangium phytohabitans]ALG12687.1 CoA-transferase [Kibdelosporangium phytohabitans]MBE1464347.1 formyl-CoA transferase [Kibdelosporangium phytohabitans]